MNTRSPHIWKYVFRYARSLVVLSIMIAVISACDARPPGSEEPAGVPAQPVSPEQTLTGGNQTQSGGGGGLLKPVGFINQGAVAYTVQAWTYIPAGQTNPATPSNASTVAFPGGGNPSSHLSLPMGTYTWCYWWELGDTNGDGMMDYAHALDGRRVVLDENDSDDLDVAEHVTLSAPAVFGVMSGQCGTAPSPSVSAAEQTARPNGELLFSDDCEGGGEAQGMFGAEYMAFSYQNGQGQLTATSNNLVLPAMYGGPAIGDFILEVVLTVPAAGPNSKASIIFRSDDVPNGLEHYNIISINPASKTIEFAVFLGNQWALATTAIIADGSISFDHPIHLRLEASGSDYRVFLDGSFAAAFVDSQITAPGIFGISISSGAAPEKLRFDNLRVYTIP